METPKRIYLQIEIDDYCEPDNLIDDLSDATWCVDRIHDTDVEYVRRDVAVKLREWAAKYHEYIENDWPITAARLGDFLTETAWLADSTDGENGEESET